MKKLKKLDLSGMERNMFKLDNKSKREIVGGYRTDQYGNIYWSTSELESKLNSGQWTGGLVDGYGYVGREFTVYGSYGGNSNYGSSNGSSNYGSGKNSALRFGLDVVGVFNDVFDFLPNGIAVPVDVVGYINAYEHLQNDIDLYKAGSLNGVALNDAVMNIIGLVGYPGAYISLVYQYGIKPAAEYIAELEQKLQNYFTNALMRGYW